MGEGQCAGPAPEAKGHMRHTHVSWALADCLNLPPSSSVFQEVLCDYLPCLLVSNVKGVKCTPAAR